MYQAWHLAGKLGYGIVCTPERREDRGVRLLRDGVEQAAPTECVRERTRVSEQYICELYTATSSLWCNNFSPKASKLILIIKIQVSCKRYIYIMLCQSCVVFFVVA